jgi:hypothetical protein
VSRMGYHAAHQRALRALATRHPDEFADLLHVEKHRLSVSHVHTPDSPESIEWWGNQSEGDDAA